MAPKLAARHPEIETYAGTGVDDPLSTVRITISPLGFQASVRGGELGAWYIDPVYQRDDQPLCQLLRRGAPQPAWAAHRTRGDRR